MVLSDSPSKTPEEIRSPSDGERPHLQLPASEDREDSPIVQEPEEPQESKEESSVRKTSLVIMEATDEQPQACERLDGDVAFEKVRAATYPLTL